MKWREAAVLLRNRAPRTSDEFAKLPAHVAVIMDGNGRWARKHKLNVSMGHRQGTENLREIIRHTDDLGIGSLSLYAFSTENWNHSPEEAEQYVRFITGVDNIDDDAVWESYVAQMESIGIARALAAEQAAYDRYIHR